MFERVMWAKFIGSDRSCGFRTGNSYRVKLKWYGDELWLMDVDTASRRCPYGSYNALCKNWIIPCDGDDWKIHK